MNHIQTVDAEHNRQTMLEMAAIFGCDFSIDWFIELSGVKASRAIPFLEDQRQNGLLARKDLSTYAFAQEDRRNEIISRIPSQTQAMLHKKVAAFLIQELPEDDKKPLLLAPHIFYCSDDIEGCRLLMKVGDMHLSDFRINEALKCYHQVINNTQKLRTRDDDELFINATIKYSKVMTSSSLNQNTEEITHFLRQAIVRAKALDNNIYNALLHMHLAKTEWIGGHFGSSIENFQKGLSIAEAIEASEALRPVHRFIPFFYFYQGLIKKAIDAHEKCAPNVEEYPKGKFSLLSTMTVGLCYVYAGMVSHGLGILNEIRDLLAKDGDDYLKCNADSAFGEALLTIKKTDDAIPFLKKSLREADRSKNRYIADIQKLQLAYAYFLKSDFKKSTGYLRSYLKNHSSYDFTLLQSRQLIKLAWRMESGEYPKIADVSLEKEIQRMMRHKNVCSKGLAYFYRALLLKKRQKSNRLIEASLKASVHCKNQDTRSSMPTPYLNWPVTIRRSAGMTFRPRN
ncbi:MAG: hypothetical protein HZB24_03690 [Desulfobacterales bacterium]|nr:hypothetical protein [Desulfobacterales bacterium]